MLRSLYERFGIRAKLVFLFVVIKVIPLVLLAILAWMGLTQLGSQVAERSTQMSDSVRDTVGQLSVVMTNESSRALDLKSREAIERLTTDTALAVAEFLKGRDGDVLLAATLAPSAEDYRQFLHHRTRDLIDPGKWTLSEDRKSWIPAQVPPKADNNITPDNPENQQDFNYRPPEQFGKKNAQPLYHEITFVGLDGQETVKVSATKLLPGDLRNVARKENTYAKAETYFAELKNLKQGEIYVSDVIGPYVRSHYYGPVTPESAEKAKIAFEPEKEAYAGKENPQGQHFKGIVRWATPVVKGGKMVGYVTLALDHDHIMGFTDHLMPTAARYTPIADATNGNYAFMWDYLDRSIAHPRHQSIIGFNPATGNYETPWLEASLYKGWQESGKPLREYLAGVPIFDHQSRDKKPSVDLIKAGIRGLDCRYLNFAPQCHGWYDLTKQGGSGSFVILWSGVWKLTTAATIPYFTGKYGKTPRGFGYVTIGANVDEFHKAATDTKAQLDQRVQAYGEQMRKTADETLAIIGQRMQNTVWSLTISTIVMVAIVIFIAIWLANLLTRRVTQLTDGLGRIEQGDLDFRLNKTSEDEMGRLAESINRMADSVQLSFQRLEEARERAEEANRMKSSFLASMSHELRTPLNGILGFAELLKLELDGTEQYAYADTIHGSGSHLLDIVNDLLDLAKIEAGRMELQPTPCHVRELLGEVAAIHRAHAEGKGLSLTEQYADDLPENMICDPKRLRQILNNLLNNAVKFTARGSVSLIVERQDNALRFSVRDTGIGIPMEQQEIIFERFQQAEHFLNREHGGTGLGLALALELVALMGGEIGLTSVPGEGSNFFFTLPLQGVVD
jgi:signal transduction histidine kinase